MTTVTTAADFFTQDSKSGKWSIPKDPNATLDYIEDWTAWLAAVGDTIASATVVVDPATSSATVSSKIISGGLVTAWITGGASGDKAAVTFHITTTNSPPRIDDRTFYLAIKDR